MRARIETLNLGVYNTLCRSDRIVSEVHLSSCRRRFVCLGARYCSSLTFPSSQRLCRRAVPEWHVRHGRGWRAPCQCFFRPVELRSRQPGRISSIVPPHAALATASRNDQRLSQRMGVPCCFGAAGFERDAVASRAAGLLPETGVNTNRASKPIGRPFWKAVNHFV